MDIQYFDRQLGIKEFLDWLATVEAFFKSTYVSEEKKVKVATHRFEGGATAWWDQLDCNRLRERENVIQT